MKFKEKQAIYLQIADHFLENILLRKWSEGEKIPSIRDTAIEYEVNPNTTIRTFNYLQDKGIIYNKRGIGYFIEDNGYNKALALKKQEFISEEIPDFFKEMNLLGISIEEICQFHAKSSNM